MRVRLHLEARAELRRAALWYEERRLGLGDEFIAVVSIALERIAEMPDSYPAWPGIRAVTPAIRKVTLQRFPYLIAFQRCRRYALVLAVAHAKRRPLYWLKRTSTQGR